MSFNISIQSNLDSDIIQFKKPFYGNLFWVEIDRKNFSILGHSSSIFGDSNPKHLENSMQLIIPWFYKCLYSPKRIERITNNIIDANCVKIKDRMELTAIISEWEVFGFINS